MSRSYNFPFGIEDVANLLELFPKRESSGDSYDVPCPFCGDKEYHMNIIKSRDVWRCNRCGENGGMLELYARVKGVSLKDAYASILNATQSEIYKLSPVRKNKTNKRPPKEAPINASLFNAAYSAYLEKLWLRPVHRANLLGRGLPEEVILANGYKSVPTIERFAVVRELTKEGVCLDKIPGFYDCEKNAEKAVKVSENGGFYIPVRDIKGNIVGMQVRTDSGKSKYQWFTSRYETNGAKAYAGPHFVGIDLQNVPKEVYLTEGPLKADVAYHLSGKPFMAIPGVSNVKTLEEGLTVLKKIGVKHIYDALDMDRLGNKTTAKNSNVSKADAKIKRIIESYTFTCSDIVWDEGKGIDDFLFEKGGKI